MRKLLVIASVSAMSAAASAAIVAVDHGTGAPPATLGPWAISALPFDTRSLFTNVTDAPGNPPLTGAVTWNNPFSLRQIGSGWATWSHGYGGIVYYSNGLTSETMTLPSGTTAFLMYLEPNPFSWQTFTVTETSGASITRTVHGSSGASGFGFYGTGGSTIASISVSASSDFAWGEFYGAVPEPGTLALLGLGALGLIRRR